MLRPALLHVVLAAAVAPACAPAEPPIPAPPRPDWLEDFSPVAVERIEEALGRVEDEPGSALYWGELGMIYNAERQRGLAVECYDVAARIQPTDPKWPYHRAVALGRLGRLDEAIAAIRRSIAIEDGYAPSHSRLGDFHMALGDMRGAREAYERATELDSSYPGGWLGLARVAMQLDDQERAVEILERLARQDPEDRTFQQMLSMARREGGEVDGLSSADVLGEEGSLPVWNDPWELESRAFQRQPLMLQVAPMMSRGEHAEVLALIDHERERGTSVEETALYYAGALYELGRLQEALAEVVIARTHAPRGQQVLVLQARILDDLGRKEEALDVFQFLAEVDPEFAGGHVARGFLLLELERPEEAVEALRAAVARGIVDPAVRVRLGATLFLLKRWEEARTVFEEVVAQHPDDGGAWIHLANTLIRLNELQGAESALERGRAAGADATAVAGTEEKLRLIRGRRERRAGDSR